MSNDIPGTRSNTALVVSTGNPECILRDKDLAFCTMYNHNNPDRAVILNVRRTSSTLDQRFGSLDHDAPPTSPLWQAQLTFATMNSNFESFELTGNHIWQIVAEEVAREHARRLKHATQQAVESEFISHLTYRLHWSRRRTEEILSPLHWNGC